MKVWALTAAATLLTATVSLADRPRADEAPEFPVGKGAYPSLPQLMRSGKAVFPWKGMEPTEEQRRPTDQRPRLAEAPRAPRPAPEPQRSSSPAEAESADLQRLATRLLLVQWKAEQVRSWFSDGKTLQSWHDRLLEHIATMADLVEGGTEQRPADPVLIRAVDVGAELESGHHGQGLHSFKSIQAVTERLRQAMPEGKEAVLDVLDQIRKIVAEGKGFPGSAQ